MPSLLNTVRDLERLRQIAGVLAVHGFGEVVDRTGLRTLIPGRKREETARMPAGIRLRKVLEDLGPSFVKLGQIMSTRPESNAATRALSFDISENVTVSHFAGSPQ